MGRTATLGAEHLVDTVKTYRDALVAHREAINRLNVYPVPDGDTGTNMSLTLESVVAELEKLNGSARVMADVCKAVSHGSLMGARGNSGVILSQILRGMTEVFRDAEQAGAPEVAAALVRASDAAHDAVMRPVEGTVLTVARYAARAARDSAATGAELEAVLDAARDSAAEALEKTPEMLPVLLEAGVVDAGGAGYLLLMDSLLHVVADRPIPPPPDLGDLAPAFHAYESLVDGAHGEEGDVSDLRYEVMYFLDADDASIPGFKEVWATIGDSIVVVGGDGLWNCHIHTDDVGAAIEAAIEVGRPRKIRVTDLAEQMEEERWVRESAKVSGDDIDVGAEAASQVTTAIVAVSNGEGIKRIFRSLGVHRFVAGGQSMNPSTADLLDAIDNAPAPEVVVLPNNSNIVPVAKSAAELSSKTVAVVPTRCVPQAFAALFEYDPEASAESNAAAMSTVSDRVVYGEVTQAVRSSTSNGMSILEGDWIGLANGEITTVTGNLADTARGLLESLVGDGAEIVTIIEGEGSSAAVTRLLTEWLADNRDGVEAEVHHGGQPLYPYLFGVD